MKVLMFEPYALNVPHFERSLEIAQRHLDAGNEVTFLTCASTLTTCDINFCHSSLICVSCKQRSSMGMNLLEGNIKCQDFYLLTDLQKELIFQESQRDFSSIIELQSYLFEGVSIGTGISSSLISATRNPRPSTKQYASWIRKAIKNALSVYFSIQNHIQALRPDVIYLFNGRFFSLRPAMEAAIQLHTDYICHDISGIVTRYWELKNFMPHDAIALQGEMQKYWNSSSNHDREFNAKTFYENNIKGKVITDRYNYIKDQQKGIIPSYWPDDKIKIVLFNSSDDEFASISDKWKILFYPSQLEGIKKIVQDLAPFHHKFHLYLRMHPNLKKADKKYVEEFYAIKAQHFTLIKPDDPIDTYTLMQKADRIATFVSTTGIEAAYWGKPSIVLSNNLYSELGSCYFPKSHSETLAVLTSDRLEVLDKTGAKIYGNFMYHYGIEYKYFQPNGLFGGTFKGRIIKPNPVSYFLGRVTKKICHWVTGMN